MKPCRQPLLSAWLHLKREQLTSHPFFREKMLDLHNVHKHTETDTKRFSEMLWQIAHVNAWASGAECAISLSAQEHFYVIVHLK